MKNVLFFLFCILFSTHQMNAQAAPTNQEAKDLVASIRENTSEVDSAIAKISALRAQAQRENNQKLYRFYGDVDGFAHQMKSLGEQVLRAGENMSLAKLKSFKTEAARLDKKMETLLANRPPAPAGMSYGECAQSCLSMFPKWWMFVRRGLCVVHCLLFW